ncbi:adenylyl-sulfate kinase [Duganella sp. FT94W]|uniref:Adenylyl-sulfate kinase n=1 Tax=Duganella lactea TaxID=2692173 RepID=A0ABW9VFY1_9BURK|nr:adenylyl-sulfate kinase [Duganella lactea]MYM37524.1 adenylyl-sulfate kinase [Duganella lactea]
MRTLSPVYELGQLERAQLIGQRPCCLWFTGLSGAGKSTLADHLERALHAHGRLTYVLDGDALRAGLNAGLGFTRADRAENVRRLGAVARLMVDAGLIVLVSAISPYREDRAAVRRLFDPAQFIEVHVSTSLAVCAARDTKGLYRRAQAGELPHLTGWSDPYEAPLAPELAIDTATEPLASAVGQVLELYLRGDCRAARSSSEYQVHL